MPKGNKRPTLCWDCRRALADSEGCSWSRWFEPVEGWEAEPTKMRIMSGNATDSFIVKQCPRFLRDAYDYGQRRPYEGKREDEVHL